MDRLPSEILLMIFRRIDDFRVMLRLERVCRRWRQLMRGQGWKHVRRVAYAIDEHTLTNRTPMPDQWVVPIGAHCGQHLVDCSFHSVTVDSNLMRLIAENLHALRHLKFDSCPLAGLDENMLDPFPVFCAQLRSLSFVMQDYHSIHINTLLGYFPRLRHIAINIPFAPHNYANKISRHYSAHLRSLYLNYIQAPISDQEQILTRLQKGSPGLKALFLNFFVITESMLRQISEMKNLRYLQLRYFDDSDLFSKCLANLPNLRALQLSLNIQQQFSAVFRFLPFRRLVHLSLIIPQHFNNFEFIGLLSNVAPQLRSLSLIIDVNVNSSDQAQKIGCEVLRIARNDILEHLNVRRASFTIAELEQLVRLCPNLHSLNAQFSYRLGPQSSHSQFAALRRIVTDQWEAGTRKHLPLRIWLRGVRGHAMSAAVWQDSLLVVRHVGAYFVPPNPVLDKLFREEVFNGNDDGGTPSFVTEHYDGLRESRVPKNGIQII